MNGQRQVYWAKVGAVWLTLWLLALPLLHGQTRELHGRDYLPLSHLAAKWGMKDLGLSGKIQRLQSQWTKLVFEEHQRDFTINGRKVFLGDPVTRLGGQLWISEKDLDKTLAPILTPQVSADPPKLYHIVIDPGHGGKDPGAQNRSLGLNEKATTLDVAHRLKRILEPYGYRVTLTRDDDRFLSLESRPQKANRLGADLFISLHFNSVDIPSVSGVETFVFTPPWQPSTSRAKLVRSDRRTYAGNRHDAWNALAGYCVQGAMVSELGAVDRGLKRARFTVLRDAEVPAMLVEMGFLSNPTEGRNIGSSAYREKIARALATGILNYQKTLNRVRGR